MNSFTGVVFDLDGTLVDSSGDIANALNRVLAPYGARSLMATEVVPLLGEGPESLVDGAIDLAGAAIAPEHDVVAEYLADYRRHPIGESRLFDGVADALGRLAETGMPMGVCTNKSEEIAQSVLEGLRIHSYFESVIGSDRLENCKPHPDHLLAAIAEIGADPASSIFVGDSIIDWRCAGAADVRFVAVPWASSDVEGERLRSFADLPAIVFGTSVAGPKY